MFGPILRWLLVRSLQRRREIYRYFDGQAIRQADPIVVLRALEEHAEFVEDRHYDQALRFGEKGASATDKADLKRYLDAMRVCASAARAAFGLRPHADGGLSEGECLDLLTQFFEYRDGVKKNISPSPTLSPTSADATLPPSSEATPNASSPSTSTADAAALEKPTSSGADASPPG